MDDILAVILDTLGILAIICFGAFIVVLVADLILSAFDKHQGIFFNRKKKDKTASQAASNQPVNVPKEATITPYINNVTITPYLEEKNVVVPEPINSEVDYDKAAQEQKLIQGKRQITSDVEIEVPTFQKEDINDEDYFAKVNDSKSDINVAINEVTKQALEELEQEKNSDAAKQAKELEDARLQAEADAKAKELEEIKQIKEELLNLRNAVKMDVQREHDALGVVSSTDVENDLQEEVLDGVIADDISAITPETELSEEILQKLKELEELKTFKEQFDNEKVSLIKFRDEALEKSTKLEQQKEELAREVEELKKTNVEGNGKPYYSLEYYENKLEQLQLELKDAEKELRANKREFIPLQRIKKSYERNNAKLRRKEAIVARQKIALFGVANSENIDPEKKEKLEEEVKLLNELKDSVFHCDQVLKQNKDRYPVLEKSNKILTKQYNRLLQDVESVEAAIAWYKTQDTNE